MPYCDVITTEKVAPAVEQQLNEELIRIIEQIPGKSRDWIMTRLQPEAHMSFAGISDQPTAMVCLNTFGPVSDKTADTVTAGFCEAIERLLGVPQDRIYVSYASTRQWGWNGGNF